MRCLIIALIIATTVLPCSGCYNRVEIDDTIGVVAHGLDVSPDGAGLVSTAQLALPVQAQAEEKDPKFLLRSAQDLSFSMADLRIAYSLPLQPAWSMAEAYIVGHSLARRDITLFLDHLGRLRTAREGSMLFIACNSTPHQVLNTEAPPEGCSGLALVKMIRAQQGQIGIYLPVSIREFLQKVGTPGIEPVLPQVAIENVGGKDRLKISGLAVFQGNRMVGSLNEQESRGYRFTQGSARGGLFNINVAEGTAAGQHTLELTQSGANVKPILDNNQLVMKIEVIADGNLYELDSSDNVIDLKQIDLFEKAAAKAIRNDIEACISSAKCLHSDIFGWGSIINSKDQALWNILSDDWPAHFAGLSYELEVDFKLRRSYLKDRSI